MVERGAGTRAVRCDLTLAAALAAGLSAAPVGAQSIEPRAYSAGPVGTNFAILAYAETSGGLPTDTALPLSEVDLKVRTVVLAYARTLNLFGQSAKIDVIVPYGKLAGDATFDGKPIQRRVAGLGDAAARLTILLHGAPAMTPTEFRTYQQGLLIGASIQVFIPVGQYDNERVLNLGTNRWALKPEFGVSKAWGRWTMEGAAGVTFFGDNKRFFGANRRTQKPIYSAQAHAIYSLAPGIWIAANLAWFGGGRTNINGVDGDNLQQNWRAGLVAAVPLTKRFSLKVNASTGVLARTGNNFDLYGTALQYRWGGGS